MALLVMTWLAAVGGGSLLMISHAQTPGAAAEAPARFPRDVSLIPSATGSTLLMFLHPQCPCSRASWGELKRLLARCEKPPAVKLVVFKPAAEPEEWAECGIVTEARTFPGVSILTDPDGVVARRFHAETSGQVLLYDSAARLVFAGGITASRGHEGGNAGSDAIVAWVNNASPPSLVTSVFGCGLVTAAKTDP